MLAHRAADALHHPFTGRLLGRGFWSHLRSFVTTMGPKISSAQYRISVS
jgi:hypothetical protein